MSSEGHCSSELGNSLDFVPAKLYTCVLGVRVAFPFSAEVAPEIHHQMALVWPFHFAAPGVNWPRKCQRESHKPSGVWQLGLETKFSSALAHFFVPQLIELPVSCEHDSLFFFGGGVAGY